MRLCVFGLGYVGCVSAAVLASRGHRVIGVDVDESKVTAVAAGEAPIVEPGLDRLIADTVADGSLFATADAAAAVQASEASLVCVGTPSGPGGEPSTEALERVVATIGGAVAQGNTRHTVVIRSTILPGTSERLLLPLLEQASGQPGKSGLRLQPGVPARGFVDRGLPAAAEDSDRRGRRSERRHRDRDLSRHPCAAVPCPDRGRRDGEVRRQLLSCAQGVLRQRDRSVVARIRGRFAPGDGHLQGGRTAQHLDGLSDAGFCLRRLMSDEGRPGTGGRSST